MRQFSGSARLGAWLAGGAILAAPFFALLYRAEAGLVVMAIALGATSLLLREAMDVAPEHARPRLLLVLGFNVVLIVACVSLAVWLVVRN